MSAEKASITKCHYRYSQINNFISVKDFMFVRENGINHLLIRFCNHSDFTVNSLAFTILQLDASGKVLKKLKVRQDSLEILPGNTYAPSAGFKVENDCCDCKIIIRRVRSGNYMYRMQQRHIVTDYCVPRASIAEDEKASSRRPSFYVRSSRTKKVRASVFFAAICLFIIITLNAVRPFAIYYKDEIKTSIDNFTKNIWAESDDSAENRESSK